MAITYRGFDTTAYEFDEKQWARYQHRRGVVNYKHGVSTGFEVTAGGGTRQASIAAGEAVLPGLLVDSSSTLTTTHNANTSGANRVDFVVLQADWVGNTVTVAVVQGSSPSAPALTQDAGTLWQMPLARVTVRPSVTTLLSTDVVACKPLPRSPLVYVGSVSTGTTVASTGTWTTVSNIVLGDPGWSYSLALTETLLFFQRASGYGQARIVDNLGAQMTYTQTNLTLGNMPVNASANVPSLSGPRTLSLQIQPVNLGSGLTLAMLASGASFTAQVVPA